MISSAPAPKVPVIANVPATPKNSYENRIVSAPALELRMPVAHAPVVPVADKQPLIVPVVYPHVEPEVSVAVQEAAPSTASIIPLAAVAPKTKVLTLRLLPGAATNGAVAIPVTTGDGMDNRAADGAIVPTRGTVIMEERRQP